MNTDESIRHADFNWAIRLNRFALNAVGLWPNFHGNARDKFLSDLRVVLSVLILTFIGLIPALHILWKVWGDMMLTIDNLQITLPISTALIKLVIIWWKKADFTLVINMIADDWLRVKTDKELRVMIKYARNGHAIAIFGYIFMAMGITFVFLPFLGVSLRYITNVTDPIKILPLQAEYIYDKNRSPYFELTYAGQTLVVLVAAACYTGIDTFLGLSVFHLCGQMENLKGKLSNMKQFNSFNRNLAFVIKDHIRLIEYFTIVESIFNLLLFLVLIYFGTIFCLYGFVIIAIFIERRDVSTVRLIYLIAILLNVSGHMGLHCLVGEILVIQCEGVYNAVYDYEWYTLKPENARTLILILIRAGKPLYITAGKIFPMTMSMFCNLIKTSSGYISVLIAKQRLQN